MEYLDDPSEICLKLPEDCPFVEHPAPEMGVEITDRKCWGPMVVRDSQSDPEATASGALKPESYIWQLCDKVLEELVSPDVVRAYAITSRGSPFAICRG